MAVKPKQEEKQSTELAAFAQAGLPAEMMEDMLADAGTGISDNPDDVGIPFIAVLADLSPQVKKRDEKYIEGAEVGMLFNNQAKEIYPHGIDFLPVFYESAQVEWVPRDAGGGFVAKHPHDTPLRSEARPNPAGKGAPRLPSGNDLVETRYWYGFYLPLGEDGTPLEGRRWEPAVIGFSSTGLGVSRDWVGMTKRVLIPGTDKVAALFSSVYRVTTQLRSKNNNDWFLPKPERSRWVTGTEYAEGKKYHEQARAGAIKVAQPDETAGHVSDDETVL